MMARTGVIIKRRNDKRDVYIRYKGKKKGAKHKPYDFKNISFNRELMEIVKFIEKGDAPQLAVALFETNHLGYAKKEWGRDYPDDVTNMVRIAIRDAFKDCCFCQCGKGKFLVLIKDKQVQNINIFFKAYESDLNEFNTANDGNFPKVSASFGVAVYDKDIDNSFFDVFDRAEAAMDEMKKHKPPAWY